MTAPLALIDTNILVYAFGDDWKGERAKAILAKEYVLSIQALNEFIRVARAKLDFSWDEVEQALAALRANALTIQSIDLNVHQSGIAIMRRYRLGVFDSLMVAAALEAECDHLFSEDMQHGLVVENRLRIENPFAQAPR